MAAASLLQAATIHHCDKEERHKGYLDVLRLKMVWTLLAIPTGKCIISVQTARELLWPCCQITSSC